jgi:hypothetical protein
LESLMKYISMVTAVLFVISPVGQSVAQAQSSVGHCPPGLAKKNPPCVPPGQVGKSYHVGDRYDGDGSWGDDDHRRYGLRRLPRGESYYRVGDSFLRVNDETRLVLELITVLTGIAD